MLPKLTLFIPELIQPLKIWKRDFGFEPQSPIFSKLFQNIQIDKTSSSGLDRSLFSSLGLASDNELPIAKYQYKSSQDANHKTIKKERILICADPVHCEVGMKEITLTQTIDELTQAESEELISILNQHFNDDGLEFILDDEQNWYLALPQEEPLSSTVLDEVIGKNIFSYLPRSVSDSGSDIISSNETRNWQTLQNEVQMLLHMSSLNQSREIAGLPTVNSLWFWGGGQGFTQKKTINMVFGGAGKGKTYSTAAASVWKDLPEKGEDIVVALLRGTNENRESVIIFDQLFKPALSDDLQSWQQQLTFIEENYLKPLVQAWQNGEIELKIDTCSGRLITPLKQSGWKFWKSKAGVSLLNLA